MKIKLSELAYEALNRGITLNDHRWSLTANGDVEVVFPFDDVADLVMFRIMVL
jgi:hypothetical protein